jgi:hypothetical protein
MDGSIELSADQRKVLLAAYRWGKDVRAARRAHIVLLVAEGWSYREVRAITFASFDLIHDCVLSFQQGGSAAVLRDDQEQKSVVPRWLLTVSVGCRCALPRTSATSVPAGRVRCWQRPWPGKRACASVVKPYAEDWHDWVGCGEGRVPWSVRPTHNTTTNSRPCATCSPRFPKTRRLCFRMKWT